MTLWTRRPAGKRSARFAILKRLPTRRIHKEELSAAMICLFYQWLGRIIKRLWATVNWRPVELKSACFVGVRSRSIRVRDKNPRCRLVRVPAPGIFRQGATMLIEQTTRLSPPGGGGVLPPPPGLGSS